MVITSTGTAAGNAAGSQVEALTAGSPLLHITSQIDRPFMDRDRAAIHDVPRQADMLKAVSKAYFRIWDAHGALGDIGGSRERGADARRAVRSAIEIPIDVQRELAPIAGRDSLSPAPIVRRRAVCELLDALAELVAAGEAADAVARRRRARCRRGGDAAGRAWVSPS